MPRTVDVMNDNGSLKQQIQKNRNDKIYNHVLTHFVCETREEFSAKTMLTLISDICSDASYFD